MTSSSVTPEASVLFDSTDGIGRITLNRPKAINALDHSMVLAISEMLTDWASDDRVRMVLLTGAGERGLCAGGDIVSIYHDAKDGGSASKDFWRDEYILNAAIARYSKPFIAIMDGIVMGGGVGLSAHAGVRIVTERSKIGLPEVGIGFVPDVGGTYLLSRAPGEIGTHVALTTARLNAGDAIACGFADYFVPSDQLPAFTERLVTGSLDDALTEFSEPAPTSPLLQMQGWIDDCYAHNSVLEIVAALAEHDSADATAAKDEIERKSPISLEVALRSLRSADEASTLEEVLDSEFRVSCACLTSADLVEGIRAQVIDKDRNPQWSPATLAEVTPALTDRFFASLGSGDLGLHTPVKAAALEGSSHE